MRKWPNIRCHTPGGTGDFKVVNRFRHCFLFPSFFKFVMVFYFETAIYFLKQLLLLSWWKWKSTIVVMILKQNTEFFKIPKQLWCLWQCRWLCYLFISQEPEVGYLGKSPATADYGIFEKSFQHFELDSLGRIKVMSARASSFFFFSSSASTEWESAPKI